MTNLLPVQFDRLRIGEEFAPIRLKIDRPFLLDQAFSLDDFSAFSAIGEDAAEPLPESSAAHLLGEMLRLLNTRYDPHFDRGLHQREEVSFHRAARLGETVELTGKIVDKYVRRGRPYFVVDAEARSLTDGSLLLTHRATEASEIGDPKLLGSTRTADEGGTSRRVQGDFDPGRIRRGSRTWDGWEAGDCFEGAWKDLRQSQIAIYSNVAAGWHTTHTDIAVAREEGLDTTMAQGLMGAGYIAELMRKHVQAWDTTGTLNLAFIKPMFPGDRLRARASLITQASDETPAEMEVWVENEAGDKTVVGWAGQRRD